MESVLNFNEPLDISSLDKVVDVFYRGSGTEQQVAQKILTQFQEHPDAWTRVDYILEYSSNNSTKYIGLQILEKLIQTRWKILPRDQCDGIKNYIVSLIIKKSQDDATLNKEKTYVNKLNLILVQILKQEWPHNWPTFIHEIVGASKTNETLCENNMKILKLLSEEIFDYSAEQMVQEKVKNLKNQLCQEFSEISQLCSFVLENATKPSLILATLDTLLKFLIWIPLGYIFETDLIKTLVKRVSHMCLF
jgi:exportin-1